MKDRSGIIAAFIIVIFITAIPVCFGIACTQNWPMLLKLFLCVLEGVDAFVIFGLVCLCIKEDDNDDSKNS